MNLTPLLVGIAALGTGLLVAASARAAARLTDAKGRFRASRYPPNSPEAVALFRAALDFAELPWNAADADLHYIMGRESGGWVGRPNYLFGKVQAGLHETASAAKWPALWVRLRKGEKFPIASHAAGLGQLQPDNAKKFYPSGLQGIGLPFEEAVGYVRYVADRYGSPKVARSVYGQIATYIHATTGAKRSKGFKEGY